MNQLDRIRQVLDDRGLDALLITDEKNQRYAAGFPFTDGVVLVTQKKAWLLTDPRYIEAAQSAEGVELQCFDREHPLHALLREDLAAVGAVRVAAEDEKLSHWDYLELERALGTKLIGAGDLLAALRASKSEEELVCMREAQAIAERAFEELLPMLRAGVTERELAASLVYLTMKHGSEMNAFDPIVVSGARTSMPHGVPTDAVVEKGSFVTLDFGCVKHGYCSDMTRTVAVGSVTDEMRSVYDTVLRAQLAGIASARAGVRGCEIDAAARRVIAEAGYGEYFGHGFGHGLGLDIHESPSANARGETPMPLNAVCSAEPGIYLPGRFGVRIEDVMILRGNGCELITKTPKQLLVLDA